MHVSYILDYEGLDEWLLSEAQSLPFQVSLNDPSADAIIVVAASEEQGVTFLGQVDFSKPCLWFGDGYDEARRRGADILCENVDDLDADELIQAATRVFETLTRQKEGKDDNVPKEGPKKRIHIPRFSRSGEVKDEAEQASEDVNNTTSQKTPDTTISHVIAVGGFSGCGASFVAWNLAYALDAVLLEGKKTGALAKWIGIDTTVDQAILEEEKFGVVLETDFPIEALFERKNKPYVIDVGNDENHPAYKNAKRRIWVTTVDPQFSDVPLSATNIVLNRFPVAWPVDPKSILKRSVDLVIPDSGRDAFLACCQHQPWLSKHPEHLDAWRALGGKEKQIFSRKDGDEEWNNSRISW